MILRSAASGQLDKVAQGNGTDLKIMYCRRVKGIHHNFMITMITTYNEYEIKPGANLKGANLTPN